MLFSVIGIFGISAPFEGQFLRLDNECFASGCIGYCIVRIVHVCDSVVPSGRGSFVVGAGNLHVIVVHNATRISNISCNHMLCTVISHLVCTLPFYINDTFCNSEFSGLVGDFVVAAGQTADCHLVFPCLAVSGIAAVAVVQGTAQGSFAISVLESVIGHTVVGRCVSVSDTMVVDRYSQRCFPYVHCPFADRDTPESRSGNRSAVLHAVRHASRLSDCSGYVQREVGGICVLTVLEFSYQAGIDGQHLLPGISVDR